MRPQARARRAELENMARFIAKKREIFLVQMALDIKSAEMRRLGDRARQARASPYHSQSDSHVHHFIALIRWQATMA